MDKLIENTKVVLADSFCFYLKAHNFHWNVEGIHFVQLHGFFGDLYGEVWGAVDAIAEHLRTLKAYAPGSLSRFKDLSSIQDEVNIPNAIGMVTKLLEDNMKVINSLKVAQTEAEKVGAVGIANFFQDRIDIHYKHDWMLRSISKV